MSSLSDGLVGLLFGSGGASDPAPCTNPSPPGRNAYLTLATVCSLPRRFRRQTPPRGTPSPFHQDHTQNLSPPHRPPPPPKRREGEEGGGGGNKGVVGQVQPGEKGKVKMTQGFPGGEAASNASNASHASDLNAVNNNPASNPVLSASPSSARFREVGRFDQFDQKQGVGGEEPAVRRPRSATSSPSLWTL